MHWGKIGYAPFGPFSVFMVHPTPSPEESFFSRSGPYTDDSTSRDRGGESYSEGLEPVLANFPLPPLSPVVTVQGAPRTVRPPWTSAKDPQYRRSSETELCLPGTPHGPGPSGPEGHDVLRR